MEESRRVSIPLLPFSAVPSQKAEIFREGAPDGKGGPQIEFALDGELPPECYGGRVEDDAMSPVLRAGMAGVFCMRQEVPALMAIFSIGIRDEAPQIRKVLKNETGREFQGSRKMLARKSFMTPTPLHIPGSRVSPIADSTHRMIYLKRLADMEAVTLVPVDKLLWMHPLVRILKPEEYRIINA